MDSTVDIVNAFGRGQHQDASAVVAVIVVLAGWLVGWSLTALSTQCRSYRAFKVRLY